MNSFKKNPSEFYLEEGGARFSDFFTKNSNLKYNVFFFFFVVFFFWGGGGGGGGGGE